MNSGSTVGTTAPPSEAVRAFQKKHVYEASGPLSQIEEDLARIRGLDQRAQRLWWAPWLALLPLAAFGGLAALAESKTWSPALVAAGLVVFIVALVVAGRLRGYDVENRRYELANGLLRALSLHPHAPVRVRLALTPITYSSNIIRSDGDWTFYRDPWLSIEGLLADGVHFHYVRTGYLDSYYHSESTNTNQGRVTRTTTKKLWHFDDAITFTYDPARFGHVAPLGPGLAAMLRLPAGLQGKLLENVPGRLHVVTHGSFQWDAAPAAGAAPGVDAVMTVAELFCALHGPLGGPSPVDAARARALPPVKAIAPPRLRPPSWLTLANVKRLGPSGVLAAGALACAIGAYFEWHDGAVYDRFADLTVSHIREYQECRKRYTSCGDEASMRARLREERDSAERQRIYALLLGLGGGALGVASIGALALQRKRAAPAPGLHPLATH